MGHGAMQDLIRDFVIEAVEHLDAADAAVLRLEQAPDDAACLACLGRVLHSIKGSCGFLGLLRLERLAHAAEAVIERFGPGRPVRGEDVSLMLMTFDRIRARVVEIGSLGGEPAGDDDQLVRLIELYARTGATDATGLTTAGPLDHTDETSAAAQETAATGQNVRVGVERLDHLMTMVSELVQVRNQLLDVARRDQPADLKVPLQRLSLVTGELQDGVMRTRLQPVAGLSPKLTRLVRDLGHDLGKEMSLSVHGGELEIDRQILDILKECAVHLIRNAADHGIEPPLVRAQAGKSPQGRIRVHVRQTGSQIICEVGDDGRGLDLPGLRQRAIASGLAGEAAVSAMSDAEVARLIFLPGVSTTRTVTPLSGRGIGLDAVKARIEQSGGTIDAHHRHGQGLSVVMTLPLTLAVAGVLIVEAGGQRYAIPQTAITELVRAQPGSEVRIEPVGGVPTLRMRDRLIPLIDLAGQLEGASGTAGDAPFVVLCEAAGRRFGLMVAAIHHTEETVIKPIASRLRHIPYFAGATVLGDGAVVLILNPAGFAAGLAQPTAETGTSPAPLLPEPDENTVPMLLFVAGGQRMAVALALVMRLEDFSVADVKDVNGHRLIAYRGGLLPLVTALDEWCAPAQGRLPVMVFQHGGRSIGVMVDEICDVVMTPLSVDLGLASARTIGVAVVGGVAVPVLDVGALFATFAGGDCPVDAAGQPLLLFEPSGFFRALLTPLMEGAGYLVTVATTPEEAQAALVRQRYAAAVCDLDDPAHSGVVDWLRSGAERVFGLATRPGCAPHAGVATAQCEAVIGKFDRQGLLAALAGTATSQGRAA